jgi:hypothetical protein
MDKLDDISGDEWKFQQDNALVYALKETIQWMKDYHLDERTIWWPVKSLDLNPIENVWR